jgi:hypothetical protein
MTTETAAATFGVTLHHLAPDLKQAGVHFADIERAGVTPEKLHTWLEALARLAPKSEYPVVPELRIAAPRGRFLVQAKNGQVRLTSWSSSEGGTDLTPERIYSLIMGTDAAEAASFAIELSDLGNGRSRAKKMALLAVAILASNAVTAWVLMRPPPPIPTSILPEYQVVSAEPAQRILATFAGDYETGTADGDRGLRIGADGALHWIRFGPNRSIAEETGLKAQPAESKGQPVLVADNHGMISMQDAITVVYFGESYRRKTNEVGAH